jgi:alkanesulfonate monooxygenase SsuD/methylene tetrahydromethanopterin reductase-like flavin-dependent oxidoreductase (luciferase family)
MTYQEKSMHLNLFLYNMGHHEASWRHPDSPSDKFLDFTYYKQLAQKAEKAKMDAIFLADRLSITPQAN